MRVKWKVYKTVVKPAMIYGVKTMAVKKPQKLGVAEMRISRWMHGVTKLDRIIVNEIIIIIIIIVFFIATTHG